MNRCAVIIELEAKKNPQLLKTTQILKDSIGLLLTAGQRLAAIVKSLKNFARLDESEYQKTNIHEGIESSLILMENEFQNRISVVKDFHDIPEPVLRRLGVRQSVDIIEQEAQIFQDALHDRER